MKFGAFAVESAAGGVLAHSVAAPGLALRKGARIGAGEIAALRAAGVAKVVVALAEPGDVGEDDAAREVANALAGPHVAAEPAFTGRCNLVAARSGVLLVDAGAIDRLNALDERVTAATLPDRARIAASETVATVKIIPFAIPQTLLGAALACAAGGALRIAPFLPLRIGVVSTLLPGLKSSTVEKTLAALASRLEGTGARIEREERAVHERGALAAALARIEPACDVVVIFGASAIADRRDVIPAAIEGCGGEVLQLGMPVDPGNLLLLGALGAGERRKPVVGAPGCARSPKTNGFDLVLNRMLAGLDVTAADIRGMGVGGLLGEIAARPQPRRAAVGEGHG